MPRAPMLMASVGPGPCSLIELIYEQKGAPDRVVPVHSNGAFRFIPPAC